MRQKPSGERRGHGRIQGLLDIGSAAITAAVAVVETSPRGGAPAARIVGIGAQRSRGVKAGVLIDLNEAEQAVRAAISQAERAAGATIDGVVASVSCGRIVSRHFAANTDCETGTVTEFDIARVLAAGQTYAERDGRVLVHMNRLGFKLDGAPGVRDPRGLAARRIAAQLHAVTTDEAPLRNLLWLIDRCNLACDGLVAAPYASGLAATAAEERELGVTCIDFGAGTTSMAMFAEGRLVGVDVIAVGAHHITFDIAKALQTPVAEAERIKTLFGALICAQSDAYEVIPHRLAERDGGSAETTRAQLAEIIRPRMAQIAALLRERLASAPAASVATGKFVLTGGGSQLIGAAEFIARELGRPARVGASTAAPGLPAVAGTPQASALVGLAIAASGADAEFSTAFAPPQSRGYLGRVGSWLRTGF